MKCQIEVDKAMAAEINRSYWRAHLEFRKTGCSTQEAAKAAVDAMNKAVR